MSLIITVLLLSWLAGTFRTYLVVGASDVPTFYSGDKVIVNRSAYDLTVPFTDRKIFRILDPGRGDMVLCNIPEIQCSDFWIKRIVGLPGDTVMILNNRLVINGNRLRYTLIRINLPDSIKDTTYKGLFAMETGMGMKSTIVYSDVRNALSDYGPVILKEGQYFILGDNRQNSLDSRIFGLVPREMIFGKFFIKISGNF
ncbi:MAG: signal peptidase I [Bacteroidales bacterium]|nr:signal peptidase I [Bacteroidales bacterium]